MRTRIPLTTITAGAIALITSGCGISNPYQHPTPPATTPHANSAPITAPTTTTPASTVPVPAPEASTPQAALTAYANGEVDWTSGTVGADQRHLASISTGAARAMALQAAATYGAGSQLQHSKVSNSGVVTSISPGEGPLHGAWVLTTREKTGGQGDYTGLPAQAHVYYAHLQHTTAGYTVSQWSPQS
jgi:hypothetical protein